MKYSIYQANETREGHSVMFMRYSFLKKMGIEPTRECYDKKYEGEIEARESTQSTLDAIYAMFNICRPDDFAGHSLSVSDIIELDGTAYYTDDFGFKQINF